MGVRKSKYRRSISRIAKLGYPYNIIYEYYGLFDNPDNFKRECISEPMIQKIDYIIHESGRYDDTTIKYMDMIYKDFIAVHVISDMVGVSASFIRTKTEYVLSTLFTVYSDGTISIRGYQEDNQHGDDDIYRLYRIGRIPPHLLRTLVKTVNIYHISELMNYSRGEIVTMLQIYRYIDIVFDLMKEFNVTPYTYNRDTYNVDLMRYEGRITSKLYKVLIALGIHYLDLDTSNMRRCDIFNNPRCKLSKSVENELKDLIIDLHISIQK